MSPNTLTPGARLAHYEIVSRLGAGGMGEVYRAHDAVLDRDVAIKVLPSHLVDDAEMRGRFDREARAVAALSHPNILSIHEMGSVEGLSFAVMELLDGESLRERISKGPLPWRTAVEFGAQAADGLAAAHNKGIVHRDIKPENLFVLADGRLKVLDFGLARWTPAGGPDSVRTVAALTQPRELLGSMGYMAPEQVLGEPVGPPADIFALGCVIYEMVTGKQAFERETPAETMAAILRVAPPPMGELAPDTPPALERILAHCLAKKPTARFSKASDVASALRALAVDSTVSRARPAHARRSRPAERSVAVLPFAYSGEPGADYLSDGLTEAVINSLSLVPGLRVVPRSTAFQYKGRDLDVTNVALALNVRSLVTGRIVTRGELVIIQAELIDTASQAQVWGHQYRYTMSEVQAFDDEVAQHITEALNVRLSHEQRKRIKRRKSLDTEAYHEYLRGLQQWGHWTADSVAKAIAHFERAIDCDPTYALAWSGLGEGLIVAGYYDFVDHAEAMPRGLHAARRAVNLDPSLAEAHAALGLALLLAEWDGRGAETALRTAVAINPRLASAHAYLSLLLGARGRWNEAVAAAQRACRLEPFSLLMSQVLCWVLLYSGQYELALTEARRMLAEDEGFAEAYSTVILCYELLGRLDKAADEWALGHDAPGHGHDRAARMKAALMTRGPKGYWEERLALAREIPDPASGLARRAQALALVNLDRLDEAVALLDEVVKARQPQAVFLGGVLFLNAFKAHPAFKALLERVGLSEGQGIPGKSPSSSFF